MNEKDPTAAPVRAQRPRNPRVPVEFPLEVAGTSADGKPFKVNAQATKISRAGATIAIEVEVAEGAVVTLTPPSGNQIRAEVNGVWVDQIDGTKRIGVKLLDAEGWFAE